MNVMKPALMAAAIVVWAALAVFAQSKPPADDLPSMDAAAALKSASPDLDARLAQFKPVRMPFNASALTRASGRWSTSSSSPARAREHVLAAERSGEGSRSTRRSTSTRRRWREACATTCSSTAAAGIWSTRTSRSSARSRCRPGHALYPADLTRAEVDAYVAAHPDEQGRALRPVHHRSQRRAPTLVGPRSITTSSSRSSSPRPTRCGRRPRSPTIRRSRSSCGCAPTRCSPTTTTRATSPGSICKNPKFDVIFAPYETYLDDLLGVKTSYGAAILIRNDAESRKLALYQKWVPDIQDALPLARRRSSVGARPRHADGSDGRAVPRGRPAPRLSGGRRQPAERSAHPPGERARRRSSSRTSWTRASTKSSCRSPRA